MIVFICPFSLRIEEVLVEELKIEQCLHTSDARKYPASLHAEAETHMFNVLIRHFCKKTSIDYIVQRFVPQ